MARSEYRRKQAMKLSYQGIQDKQAFEAAGIKTKWGNLVAGTDTKTAVEGVFSGGDCVTGPATVIRAIAAGKAAAANIDEYLGFKHEIKVDVEVPTPSCTDLRPRGRVNCRERAAAERKNDFVCIGKLWENQCLLSASPKWDADSHKVGFHIIGRFLQCKQSNILASKRLLRDNLRSLFCGMPFIDLVVIGTYIVDAGIVGEFNFTWLHYSTGQQGVVSTEHNMFPPFGFI